MMTPIDVTSIVLGLLTFINGLGWLVDRKRHRQEIESLKADTDRKYLDLATEFAKKFKELIAEPLEAQITELRTEVKQLRNAINKIGDCPHSGHCPVRDELRKQQEDD